MITKQRSGRLGGLVLLGAVAVAAAWAAPEDSRLPGTQPSTTDVAIAPQSAQLDLYGSLFIPAEGVFGVSCDECHRDSLEPARPYGPWEGSMMSLAARDPLFYAQLDLANADPADRPQIAGMADMCLRCHSPVAWLEGRSADLTGMGLITKDMYGVQCHACHRMVDPLVAAKHPTHVDAANILAGLGPTPAPTDDFRPTTYGNGMYVMDPRDVRRGPYGLGELEGHLTSVISRSAPPGVGEVPWATAGLHSHPVMKSDFHREGDLCGTCHDVSNPTDCEVGATKGDVQRCFPIERTWTEWRYSDFYDAASTDPDPVGGQAGNCQSCHMSGPLNGVSFGAPCSAVPAGHFGDIHFHDLTGGNVFMLNLIKEMAARRAMTAAAWCTANPGPTCMVDQQNFIMAVDGLYPPVGSSPFVGVVAAQLDAGIARVRRTLKRAAYLEVLGHTATDMTVRVTNRTGHKLPTGYPEGRRMWLNVRFLDAAGNLIAESGHYDPNQARLYHDQNLDGAGATLMGVAGEGYDVAEYTNQSLATTGEGRPSKVWEARLHYDDGMCEMTDTCIEFHFTLNNKLELDNRIPPQGWQLAGYTSNRALPEIPAHLAAWNSDYGLSAGPQVHFEDLVYLLPTTGAAVDRVALTLYYQTASKEYIDALAADNPNTMNVAGWNRGTLLQAEWARTGRSAPVVMARHVYAILDGDGDGLSNGWENEHGLNLAANDYNGDPDGDGLPNWQEFLNDTDPTGAAGLADPGVMPRDPVNVVLVLDTSGSMNGLAPGTAVSKIEVLRDAASLLIEVWRDYAVPADELGLVYFGSNADPFATPLLQPYATAAGPVLADIAVKPASGWTAMGAGLHAALQAVAGSPNDSHVILFSNGMQNRSPMIVPNAMGDLMIRDQTSADNPDVTGSSSLVLGADYALPAAVRVHTVGVGVAGTNALGDGWHKLLQDLANQQNGKHNFITQAFEMEGVFLEDLVEALKGSTLEYIDSEPIQITEDAPGSFEFVVNPTATRFSVAVSWTDDSLPGPVLRLLRPDGEEEPLARILRAGSDYQIATRYLTDVDSAPDDYGAWRLELGHPGRQRYRDDSEPIEVPEALDLRVHAVLDDADLKYTVRLPGLIQRIGEPLRTTVMVGQAGRLLRGTVDVAVTIDAPAVSGPAELARRTDQLADPSVHDNDQTSSPYARKLLAAFADPEWNKLLTPGRTTLELKDDGQGQDNQALDGVFEAELLRPTVPGHYRVHYRISGQTRYGREFLREETRSVVVQIGRLDGARSEVHLVRGDDGPTAVLTPRDAAGNLLGPGFATQLIAATAKGVRLPAEDLLDGSYRLALPADFDPDEPIRLVMDGEVFFDDPVREEAPTGSLDKTWWILLLLLLALVGIALVVLLLRRRSA